MTTGLLIIYGLIFWRFSRKVYGPWNEDLSLVHHENLDVLKSRAIWTGWTTGLTTVATRVALVVLLGA